MIAAAKQKATAIYLESPILIFLYDYFSSLNIN